mgnify:FL=1
MIAKPPSIEKTISLSSLQISKLVTKNINKKGKIWYGNVRAASVKSSNPLGSLSPLIGNLDLVPLVVGDLILIKDQLNPVENGIYIVKNINPQVWERIPEFSTGIEIENLTVYVEEGLVNRNKLFNLSGKVTIGITDFIILPTFRPDYPGYAPAGNDYDIQLSITGVGFGTASDINPNGTLTYDGYTLTTDNLKVQILQITNSAELGNFIPSGTFSYPKLSHNKVLITEIINDIFAPALPNNSIQYNNDSKLGGGPVYDNDNLTVTNIECENITINTELNILENQFNAGTYNNATITVKSTGQITSIQEGDKPVGNNGSFQFSVNGVLQSTNKMRIVSNKIELETVDMTIDTSGTATLVNGTVTVPISYTGPNGMTNYTVIITRTSKNGSTLIGNLYAENKTNISFDINSYFQLNFNNEDQSIVDWVLVFIN